MSTPHLDRFINTELGSRLALELVSELRPIDDIHKDYAISAHDVSVLSVTPWFAKELLDKRTEWRSMANIDERIRAKAAVQLEHGQIQYSKILASEDASLALKVDVLNSLHRLAALDKKPQRQQQQLEGEKFTLNFMWSGGSPTVIEGTVVNDSGTKALPTDAFDKDALLDLCGGVNG